MKADYVTLNIVLPVGISFYTFQTLSYVIDVYRKTVKAENNFFMYALFVSFSRSSWQDRSSVPTNCSRS